MSASDAGVRASNAPATRDAADRGGPRALPEVIFFDVNETLLDLAPMRASVGEALGGRENLLPLWFSKMLHYSLVANETDDYHDFADIGVAALMMVAENNDVPLTEEAARTAIVTPLRSLPPHPDVRAGLGAIQDQGFTMVTLTNSSNRGVNTQLSNADLQPFFSRKLSIEDIELYKPAIRSYEWALEQMDVRPEDAMLVAAHGWDIAGAEAAGMQTAFVARPGKSLYPLAPQPDYVVDGLNELAEVLAGQAE